MEIQSNEENQIEIKIEPEVEEENWIFWTEKLSEFKNIPIEKLELMPEYLNVLKNLARTLKETGENIESNQYFTIASRVEEKSIGKNHPDHIQTLIQLAILYTEDPLESIKILEEVLKIQEENLKSKETPDYATTLFLMGNFSINNGEEAFNYYEQARKIQEKTIGKQTFEYSETLLGISRSFQQQANWSEALNFAKQALEIQEKTIGKQTIEYAKTLKSTAVIMSELPNQREETLQLYEESRSILKEIVGTNDHEYKMADFHLREYLRKTSQWWCNIV